MNNVDIHLERDPAAPGPPGPPAPPGTPGSPGSPLHPTPTSQRRRKHLLWIMWILLGLAGAQFMWRGPMTAVSPRGGHDFSMMYAAARVWLEGGNPYQFTPVVTALRENGGDKQYRFTDASLISLYPPTLYVIVAPLSKLSWPTARTTWMALNLVALIGLGIGLIRLSGGAGSRLMAMPIIIVMLAWAPVHSCLKQGQTSIVVTTLIVLGLSAIMKRREIAGGGLLGLALALKPHIGGLFVLYLLLRRSWKAATCACVVVGVIGLIGLVRLQQTSPGWVTDWSESIRRFTTTIGDSTQSNPRAHQTINLHYLLHTFTNNRAMVSALVYGLIGLPLLLALYLAYRASEKTRDLALLSVLALASLLLVYHRFYDATMLLVPVSCVAARVLEKRTGVVIWVSVLMLLPFLLPGTAILGLWVKEGAIPTVFATSWWWRNVVMTHQVWALCALMLCMLWAMVEERRRETVSQ